MQPAGAAHTLLGSAIGCGVGVAMGAPASEITAGLWGFNSCLTSLAVSVFFVASAAPCDTRGRRSSQGRYARGLCASLLRLRSGLAGPSALRAPCEPRTSPMPSGQARTARVRHPGPASAALSAGGAAAVLKDAALPA